MSNMLVFLARCHRQQRSFSNTDSSVVRHPSSSSVVCRRCRRQLFRLKSWYLENRSITFFLLTHIASMACQLWAMKSLTPLNHSKGTLGALEGTPHGPFLEHNGQFLENCSITFLLIMHIASKGSDLPSIDRRSHLKCPKGTLGTLKGPLQGLQMIIFH